MSNSVQKLEGVYSWEKKKERKTQLQRVRIEGISQSPWLQQRKMVVEKQSLVKCLQKSEFRTGKDLEM